MKGGSYMKKIFGLIIAVTLLTVLAFQVQFVSAKQNDERHFRFLTSPLTSPCKPGWGFGDKNHCHTGPPGQSISESEKNTHRE